jgi:hypothetical protein
MTNEERWTELLKLCTCEAKYSIELHGDGYVLYHGRCGHRHGYNLVYLNDPAFNCDLKHIEKLINLGAAEYAKNPDGGHLAE